MLKHFYKLVRCVHIIAYIRIHNNERIIFVQLYWSHVINYHNLQKQWRKRCFFYIFIYSISISEHYIPLKNAFNGVHHHNHLYFIANCVYNGNCVYYFSRCKMERTLVIVLFSFSFIAFFADTKQKERYFRT